MNRSLNQEHPAAKSLPVSDSPAYVFRVPAQGQTFARTRSHQMRFDPTMWSEDMI